MRNKSRFTPAPAASTAPELDGWFRALGVDIEGSPNANLHKWDTNTQARTRLSPEQSHRNRIATDFVRRRTRYAVRPVSTHAERRKQLAIPITGFVLSSAFSLYLATRLPLLYAGIAGGLTVWLWACLFLTRKGEDK